LVADATDGSAVTLQAALAALIKGQRITAPPRPLAWSPGSAQLRSAPTPMHECSSRLDRRASRALRLVSRRPRSRRLSGHALGCACAPTREEAGSSVRQASPPRSPQLRPRPLW